MMLSDVAVKRPVFATVLALILVTLGVLSFRELPVREYPKVVPPVIGVQVRYPGASAAVVETQITQPIEDQINGIEGVKYIRSSSSDGSANINVEFSVDRDLETAANDVRDRVGRIADRLPDDADPPEISKQDSDSRPDLYLNLTSSVMDSMALTDYAERYVVDQLASIPGVANVSVSGSGRYAMRVWLDRTAMAARGITVTEIENALRRENLELPAGRVDSIDREFSVRIDRGYNTAQDFRQLVLRRGADGHLIRLGEVAQVEVGSRNLRTVYRANGQNRIGLGITKQSTANTLEVLTAARERMQRINESLPEGTQISTGQDASVFITAAIGAVYETIGITTALVALVILMFLGSFRAMLIPVVTIPVCLISAFIFIAAFGYTVNLVTLLALVLSIGLVVDDSIVVLENIHRRIEEGEPPLLAAFLGARQVLFAVIATTAVLIAVFVPLAFLRDNIGRIFAELAITVSAAVLISSLLALSLTPMMCSKLLRPEGSESRLTRWLDRGFASMSLRYERSLRKAIHHPVLFTSIVVATVFAAYGLMNLIPEEFAPAEDSGQVFTRVSGPEGASFPYMSEQMTKLEDSMKPWVDSGDVEQLVVALPAFGNQQANVGVMLISMAPWDKRSLTTAELLRKANAAWSDIPGVRAFPAMRSGLSGGRGSSNSPVQFVIQGSTYEELAQWRDVLLARAAEYPGIARMDHDFRETKPELVVVVDRNRAADLGVSVQSVGRTLQTMMSERNITTYVDGGEEYDVILQAKDSQRTSPQDLSNIYVRSDSSGQLIPLSNLTRIENQATAGQLNRYNRLRAVTLSGDLAPGQTLGDALAFLENVVRTELPPTAQIDYKGESLEYKESRGGLLFTFVMALLVVYLVLAAQFESFVHPLIVMLTVPLAVSGALLGLFLTGSSMNIYSQIGLVMLVGIAAKNGILIVEFANQMRDAGRAFEDALLEAAKIRLRPILMTTSATVMGSVPLMLASGPGSESRITLGVVIFWGVSITTLMTLFVVPTFYRLLARNTGSPGAVAAALEHLQPSAPRQGAPASPSGSTQA